MANNGKQLIVGRNHKEFTVLFHGELGVSRSLTNRQQQILSAALDRITDAGVVASEP
jgi:hypothetical protein